MAQLSDDCFAHGGPLMRFDSALELLAQRLTAVTETESLPLQQALGCILRQDLVSALDVPPGDNSAVDGYALRHEDLDPDQDTRLRLAGRAAAGHPWQQEVQPGTAVRIFTGAPMPPGADTVMMQEDCREADGWVELRPGIKPGANRRLSGEDISAGTKVLPAGRRLRAVDLGQAAAIGQTELVVSRPLRVALLSTGDELCEPGETLAQGQIYDSNRRVLFGLLQTLGCAVTDLGILKDERTSLAETLESTAAHHDLIVTSGGVSGGEEDHVKQAVEQAGGQLHFWRLAIKPGRPVALGQIARVPVIGLPGNPAAVVVTFLQLARPLILQLMGGTPQRPPQFPVTANFTHRKKKDRREWLRVHITHDQNGFPLAEKFARDGAGILSSLAETDGLAELPEDLTNMEPGTTLFYTPYSALFHG
ncbi:MAG: gephyrin-like molybdotransferase Glp [Pseudomonadota bacterium]